MTVHRHLTLGRPVTFIRVVAGEPITKDKLFRSRVEVPVSCSTCTWRLRNTCGDTKLGTVRKKPTLSNESCSLVFESGMWIRGSSIRLTTWLACCEHVQVPARALWSRSALSRTWCSGVLKAPPEALSLALLSLLLFSVKVPSWPLCRSSESRRGRICLPL